MPAGPVDPRHGPQWRLHGSIHDQLAHGCRFRIFSVIDDVMKECLAVVADTSISGRRVARESRAVSIPAMVVVAEWNALKPIIGRVIRLLNL